MKRSFVGLSLLVLFWASVSTAETRKWKDTTGKYEIEAEFVDFSDGKVTLKRTDGSDVSVPMTRLSGADQAFVRAELKARRDSNKPSKPTAKPGSAKPDATETASSDWPQWRGP